MRRIVVSLMAVALCAAAPPRVHAQGRLTPAPVLRELHTDRPDKTESPYTVDRGHVQIESDLITWTRDRVGSTTTQSWALMPINIKLGVHSRVDVQFISEPFTGERVRGEQSETSRGFGTITARLKFNVWGNDGGRTAFGLMPFVTMSPSAPGRPVEGGLIIPLAIDVGGGWGVGTMLEADVVAIEGTKKHRGVLASSITAARDLTDRLGFYVEFFNEVSGSPWVATADGGFTFGVTPGIQLDAGMNVGLTRAAEGVNPFLGFSIRF